MNDLDDQARAAYLAGAENPNVPWDELPEWIRESWRCEVDETRDPDRIHVVWAAERWAEEQDRPGEDSGEK